MCKLQTNPLGTQIRNAKYVNLTNANAKPTTNKEDPSSMKPTSEENNQTYSFTVLNFKMTKINLGSDAKEWMKERRGGRCTMEVVIPKRSSHLCRGLCVRQYWGIFVFLKIITTCLFISRENKYWSSDASDFWVYQFFYFMNLFNSFFWFYKNKPSFSKYAWIDWMSQGIPIIWDDCWLLLAAFVSLSASALRNIIHKEMAFTIYMLR